MPSAKDKETSTSAHEREGQMSNTVQLIGTLSSDFVLSMNRLAQTNAEFIDGIDEPVNDDIVWESQARNTVRAFFAYIEGTTYSLKVFAAVLLKLARTPLSSDELVAVYEIGSTIDNKGDVVPQPIKTTLENNLLYMIKLQERAWKTTAKIDKNEKWWLALKRILIVRNRLMHPKNVQHIKVNFEDIIDTVNAYEGFNGVLESIMGFKLGATHVTFNLELIKELRKSDK